MRPNSTLLKIRDRFLRNRRSRVPASIRQTTWRNQLKIPVIMDYRTVGYVCDVQIFAKFANESSIRKNFCWKRQILIFLSEQNVAQAFSWYSIQCKSASCLTNLAIAEISA